MRQSRVFRALTDAIKITYDELVQLLIKLKFVTKGTKIYVGVRNQETSDIIIFRGLLVIFDNENTLIFNNILNGLPTSIIKNSVLQ